MYIKVVELDKPYLWTNANFKFILEFLREIKNNILAKRKMKGNEWEM